MYFMYVYMCLGYITDIHVHDICMNAFMHMYIFVMYKHNNVLVIKLVKAKEILRSLLK